MRKRGLYTIRHRPQFLRMCIAMENTAKKVLWIRQKTAYSDERILRNAQKSDELLSTHYSDFVRSFQINQLFLNLFLQVAWNVASHFSPPGPGALKKVDHPCRKVWKFLQKSFNIFEGKFEDFSGKCSDFWEKSNVFTRIFNNFCEII